LEIPPAIFDPFVIQPPKACDALVLGSLKLVSGSRDSDLQDSKLPKEKIFSRGG
jgi:hypothetical protein